MGINRGHGRQGVAHLHLHWRSKPSAQTVCFSEFKWRWRNSRVHLRKNEEENWRTDSRAPSFNGLATSRHRQCRTNGSRDRRRIRHRCPCTEKKNQTCSCWLGMARQNAGSGWAWPLRPACSKIRDAGQQMGLSQCDARKRRRNKGDSPWSASRRLPSSTGTER